MRFHNLTITLTLTCLSIVAIVALALLPITNAIGEWTISDDGYSGSYYISHNEDNDSWTLSAGVNAKSIDASGGVSVLSLGRYTDPEGIHEQGTAALTATRFSYNYRHSNYWDLCDNYGWDDDRSEECCLGHYVPKEADSNIDGNTGYEPDRHTDIFLRVQVTEKVDTKVEVYGEEESSSFILTIGGEWRDIGAGVTFTHQGKDYTSKSESQKVGPYKEAFELPSSEEIPSSQSVSVSFEERANSAASVYLSFKDITTSQTGTYTAP